MLEAIKAETGEDHNAFLKRLIRLAITTNDPAFWRIIVDRWLPPIKGEDPLVNVDVPKDAPLGEKGTAVFAAIAGGEITPQQGATMIGALSNIAKIIEFTEFEKRLVALERAARGEVVEEVAEVREALEKRGPVSLDGDAAPTTEGDPDEDASSEEPAA